MRFDLREGRVASTLPLRKRFPVLTNVATNGTSFLLTWHDGETGYWGIAAKDGWTLEPNAVFDGDAGASAYWDSARKVYVVGTRPQQSNTRHFTVVDEAGKVKETITLEGELDLAMISVRSFCPAGDEVLGDAGYATCRGTLSPTSKWKCVSSKEHAPRCPESTHIMLPGARGVMQRDGHVESVKLPPALQERFNEPTGVAYTTIGPSGSVPHFNQSTYGKSAGPLVSITDVLDGWVTARALSSDEANALGHQPQEELELEAFDATGARTGHAFVGDSLGLRTWMGAAGDDLMLVNGDLTGTARFDRRTLARRDAIPTFDAVRERLSRWGGQSWTFELGLSMTLALPALLPLFGVFWLVGRTTSPGGARAIWATRVMAILVAFAIPTLLALASRFYQR